MHYIGKITNILKEELVGKNNLRKRSIVLEEVTDRDYKGSIVVDFIKNKCDLLDKFNVGDTVKVGLNFRANEYNGKRYNSINGWSIFEEKRNVPNTESDYDDELPFS